MGQIELGAAQAANAPAVPGNESSGQTPEPPVARSDSNSSLPSVGSKVEGSPVGDETAGSPKDPNAQLNGNLDIDNIDLSSDPPVLLQKFTLYETRNHFYIVGSNTRESRFRILKISLEDNPDDMLVEEPHPVLTRVQMLELLAKLETEARSEGDALSKRTSAWGILGMVRFTGVYYLCLVTKCSVVALMGGHYMFHIDETKLVPIVHSSIYRVPDRRSTEARLAGIFHSMDLAKTFYFSPSYDLTNTLQTNLLREKQHRPIGRQEMFMWNSHLLAPLLERFDSTMDWCVAMIHGFIDQAKLSVFGNSVYLTLIARRSHYFAGARFHKRGATAEGHVANEVESEQIVSNQLISSFHDPRTGWFNSPRYTSFVQHRGSIPLSWSQDTGNMSPKPPIKMDAADPFYSTAARHFDSMLGRYGGPIQVLNLVKVKERTPRESVLGKEFARCISYLNKWLPEESKIQYTAWDMSRASKGRSSEVIDYLEKYAHAALKDTKFFHNGTSLGSTQVQQGVCRTNCIDCLDRTNAAQSVLGKCALGYQLQAIGIIDHPYIDYDTDAVDLLTEMYHDKGDTLAIQYGGSNLVNTVETYRKINQWRSHSRDLIESVRRFYTNSFVDSNRQDAINVFLGNYQYDGSINLWELSTDYYLHHSFVRPVLWSYTHWFTPAFLVSIRNRLKEGAPLVATTQESATLPSFQMQLEHYWNRLYQPKVLTTLATLFVRRMNSTERYMSDQSTPSSPFALHVRKTKSRHGEPARIKEESVLQLLDAQSEAPTLVDELTSQYDRYMHTADIEALDTYEEPEVNDELVTDEKVYEASCLPNVEWHGYHVPEWPVRIRDEDLASVYTLPTSIEQF